MNTLIVILSALIILAGCKSQDALQFYISPDGDDSQPGTMDAPIATFKKAEELIRQHGDRDLIFYLRGGTYRLDETFVISKDVWPGDDHTLQFIAYQEEIPVICADREVTGWTRVETSEYGLPPSATGKVWIADIPKGVADFNALYYKGKMLPRARSEGYYPVMSGRDLNLREYDKCLLHFPDGSLKTHENINDVEIAAKVSVDIAAGLVACSQAMGQSLREDIGLMFGQFHMKKAQAGAALLRLSKKKGWVMSPPLHVQQSEQA